MQKMLCAAALVLCAALALACFAPALADFGDFDTGGDYDSWDSDDGGRERSPLEIVISLAVYAVIYFVVWIITLIRKLVYKLTMRDMADFSKEDPDFDEASLGLWVRDLYGRMQASWENGSIYNLQDEFSPECWNRFNRQLQEKNGKGFTGHVRDIRFVMIRPKAWRTRGTDCVMDVELQTSIISWNTNSAGAVVNGNKTDHKLMKYVWRLRRAADKRTDPDALPCPQCGRLNRQILAHCPDCGKALNRDKNEWVVTNITGSQDNSSDSRKKEA